MNLKNVHFWTIRQAASICSAYRQSIFYLNEFGKVWVLHCFMNVLVNPKLSLCVKKKKSVYSLVVYLCCKHRKIQELHSLFVLQCQDVDQRTIIDSLGCDSEVYCTVNIRSSIMMFFSEDFFFQNSETISWNILF